MNKPRSPTYFAIYARFVINNDAISGKTVDTSLKTTNISFPFLWLLTWVLSEPVNNTKRLLLSVITPKG